MLFRSLAVFVIAQAGYQAAFAGLAGIMLGAAVLFSIVGADRRPGRTPQGRPAVL